MGGPKRPSQTISSRQAAIEIELRERLSQAIQAEREALGWTQEQLAAKAGIHWTTVGKVERGRQIPSLALLVLFCDALGVPVGELLAKVLRVEAPSADDATVTLVASLPRGERADLLPLLTAMIEWRGRR